MRSTTNKELIERIEKEHLAFVDLATSIPKMRYTFSKH